MLEMEQIEGKEMVGSWRRMSRDEEVEWSRYAGLSRERWGRTFRNFSQCSSLFSEIYDQSYPAPLSTFDCFFDSINEVWAACTYIGTTIGQRVLSNSIGNGGSGGEKETPRTIHLNHYIHHVPSPSIPWLDP
jgi:hypothetical protein